MRGKGGIKQTAQTSSPSTFERHGGQEVNRFAKNPKEEITRSAFTNLQMRMVAASFRLKNDRESPFANDRSRISRKPCLQKWNIKWPKFKFFINIHWGQDRLCSFGGPTHQPQRLRKSPPFPHCAQTLDFDFRINSTPAMSTLELKYVELDYADACRRLRDNDPSMKALRFANYILEAHWKIY